MKIGELAKRAGVSVHTLRYYERIGLLPYALRDSSGQRAYDASILVWIGFLGRMKTAGMPIREMLRYAALRERGPDTAPERQALLEGRRAEVLARIAELRDCLLVLDTKIAGYAGQQRTTNHDAPFPDQPFPEQPFAGQPLPARRREPARPRPARARGD